MSRIGVAVRPPPLHGLGSSLPTLALTAALAGLTALVAGGGHGPSLRLLCACVVAFALIMLALTRPAAGVVATLAFLVLLAFLRRLLIVEAPWQPGDPLLLVGPLVASVLLVKVFVLERRPLAGDWLSKLGLALFLLTVAQAANPASGVAAGITGLFMAVPLMWFFVGRELLTDRVGRARAPARRPARHTRRGVRSAPDRGWPPTLGPGLARVRQRLRVALRRGSGSRVRDLLELANTRPSRAPFVVAVAFVLRGKALALLLPLLAVALFLASSRTALLTAVLAPS